MQTISNLSKCSWSNATRRCRIQCRPDVWSWETLSDFNSSSAMSKMRKIGSGRRNRLQPQPTEVSISNEFQSILPTMFKLFVVWEIFRVLCFDSTSWLVWPRQVLKYLCYCFVFKVVIWSEFRIWSRSIRLSWRKSLVMTVASVQSVLKAKRWWQKDILHPMTSPTKSKIWRTSGTTWR